MVKQSQINTGVVSQSFPSSGGLPTDLNGFISSNCALSVGGSCSQCSNYLSCMSPKVREYINSFPLSVGGVSILGIRDLQNFVIAHCRDCYDICRSYPCSSIPTTNTSTLTDSPSFSNNPNSGYVLDATRLMYGLVSRFGKSKT
jgi:hypothetical protein